MTVGHPDPDFGYKLLETNIDELSEAAREVEAALRSTGRDEQRASERVIELLDEDVFSQSYERVSMADLLSREIGAGIVDFYERMTSGGAEMDEGLEHDENLAISYRRQLESFLDDFTTEDYIENYF